MVTLGAGAERRRSLRAPVHGTVVLRGDHRAVPGHLANLSLGGALVRTVEPLGRADLLDVVMHLPERAHIAVACRAVRTERRDNGPRVAIRFVDLSADAEDAIEDEVVGSLAAARTRAVLVVDGVEDRRLDIADALRARAMTPLTPGTPLEVVHSLGKHRIDLCVMSTRFGDLRGAEVSRFITELFPWVRIMVIQDDADTLAADLSAAWDDIDAQGW